MYEFYTLRALVITYLHQTPVIKNHAIIFCTK